MILVLCLFIVILIMFFLEYRIHRSNLDKIPIRILVNGTRGKTTVTRLIYASLNEHGIRTYGRTTGSSSEELRPDGGIDPVIRKHGARITEFIPFVRKARRAGVEAIAVECMALQPENQKTLRSRLIRPTHVVITNSFIDHIAEMGPKREDVLWTLSLCCPKGAKLYVIDDEYSDMDAEVHVVPVREWGELDTPVKMHDSNLSLAYELLSSFGITEEEMIKAAHSIKPDIGLLEDFAMAGGAVFRPSFSVNDYECMCSALKSASGEFDRIEIVFNNRKDREYRLPVMRKVLDGNPGLFDKVYLIGDYKKKCCRYLGEKGTRECIPTSSAELIETMDGAGSGTLFLALGNIKGEGEEMIASLIENKERL